LLLILANVRRIQEINPDIIRNAINGATNKGPYHQVLVLPDLLALKYKPISGTSSFDRRYWGRLASTLKEFDPCLALLPTYKAKSSQVPGGRDPTFGPFTGGRLSQSLYERLPSKDFQRWQTRRLRILR
ncbi:hypothetical protein MCOR13_007040, partial [Pyricularia oryzae]